MPTPYENLVTLAKSQAVCQVFHDVLRDDSEDVVYNLRLAEQAYNIFNSYADSMDESSRTQRSYAVVVDELYGETDDAPLCLPIEPMSGWDEASAEEIQDWLAGTVNTLLTQAVALNLDQISR